MIRLITPTSTSLLPSPDLANTEEAEDVTIYREMLDGTPYSYVRKGGWSKLSYTFRQVGAGKMLEVQELMIAFTGQKITLIDHRDVAWIVLVAQDSLSVTRQNRADPAGEAGAFSLNFVGKRA